MDFVKFKGVVEGSRRSSVQWRFSIVFALQERLLRVL